MATEYGVQVDDLVLFFGEAQQGGDANDKPTVVNRWLPYQFYTAQSLKASPDSLPAGWEGTVFMEAKTKDNEVYYFANLSRLVSPLLPEDVKPERQASGLPDVTKYSGSPAAGGDLVVVPYDDPQSCYRIPKELYRACPALAEKDIADLDFMAVQEGVLFANVPKVELTGISCFLLNLLSLRSSAVASEFSGLNKAGHARAVSAAPREGRPAGVGRNRP
jgi:hypothetical protein